MFLLNQCLTCVFADQVRVLPVFLLTKFVSYVFVADQVCVLPVFFAEQVCALPVFLLTKFVSHLCFLLTKFVSYLCFC